MSAIAPAMETPTRPTGTAEVDARRRRVEEWRLVGRTVFLTALLVWPFLPGVSFNALNTGILTSEYLVVTLSLVLLIGYVGQISLAQAALVGMGAFVSAALTIHWRVHFPFTLIVGMVAGAASAALIGVVALRVRGLFLAVATLIFGYLCDQYLFVQPWLVQTQSGASIGFESIGEPGRIPSFDLSDAHVFYFVGLVVACTCLYSVANLRDSRIGRGFAAVRGSEVAAASLGIDVVRYKLLGFACSGALAGLGGALVLVGQRNVSPSEFDFIHSLNYLAIAVVGGLRSLGGAIAAALLFAFLQGILFVQYPTLADYLDLISAGLLVTVLLFFRGGLGTVPERVALLYRGRVAPRLARRSRPTQSSPFPRRAAAALRAAARRLPQRRRPVTAPAGTVALPAMRPAAPLDVVRLVERLEPDGRHERTVMEAPAPVPADSRRAALLEAIVRQGGVAGAALGDGRRGPVLISADEITVRFGGLTAVNGASLQVGAGEIVGLIGPNGAGKTTLFNSILGLNQPTAGRVQLHGRDVSDWAVHRRAALGVGRTFQVLQLFGDLTVFDNLLVATHLQSRTGLLGSLFVTPRARRQEHAARARVRAVLRLMDLEEYAHRRVAGLPFGVLRLIEVARTLVTGAPVVCFDEPASGLDSAETERLIEWFQLLRQIGVTLLVIEHDVSMVVRLCDWIYVLDQGRLIASGAPADIQRNQAVIDAYLGKPAEVA